jgi:hypothetical protein
VTRYEAMQLGIAIVLLVEHPAVIVSAAQSELRI